MNEDAAAVPGAAATNTTQEQDEWLFSCRCESAKSVSTLLSCLRHISSHGGSADAADKRKTSIIQPVSVFCSPNSLTFHVYGVARQSQASVDLQSSLFSEYRVTQHYQSQQEAASTTSQTADWQAGGEFCVNLSTVLECLYVLGTQTLDRTKLSLSYNLTQEIFKVELLQDMGVLATAAIPGMLPEESQSSDSLAHAFRSTPIVARIICTSSSLYQAITELQSVPGVACCTVSLGTDGLEFAVLGTFGECLVSLPQGPSMVSLECCDTHAHSYPFHSLVCGMRGLEFAQETCLSMNQAGMLAIQHQVLDTIGQGNPNYVDFIMACLQDEDDDGTSRGTQEIRGVSPSVATANHHHRWEEASKRSSLRGSAMTVASGNSNFPKPTEERDHESDEDDDEEDDDLAPASKAPLFGQLDISHDSRRTNSGRNVRRRRPASRNKEDEGEGNDDDDESRALLKPELDVTARATPPRRRRREDAEDGASSPELVFQ
jgi:hypothetical protein